MALKSTVRAPVRRYARLVIAHMDKRSGKKRTRKEMNDLVKEIERKVVPSLVKPLKSQ